MTNQGGPSAVVTELFPMPEECERINDALTGQLIVADQRIANGAVTPTLDLESFGRELASFDFCSSRPLEEVLSWTIAGLQHGVVHVTHPRYFGLFSADITGAVRGSHRRGLKPTAGDADDIACGRRNRGPSDPIHWPARRFSARSDRPLYERRS
jgi:hypothetical protein